MATLLIPLFGPEVDSLDHPKVAEFRALVERGCQIYRGRLTAFAVSRGAILFSVTSEEMANDMLESWLLLGVAVEIHPDGSTFVREAKAILEERG